MVAHDLGGACVSYAMEMFPSKVAKAVFLCAAMLTNGNSALDMFQQQVGLLPQSWTIDINESNKTERDKDMRRCLCVASKISIVFF